MNAQTLQIISDLKGLRQADLARMAGVSRQAVSLWFQKAQGADQEINLHARNQKKLAAALGTTMDELSALLPLYEDERELQSLEIALLWDRLYGSLPRFIAAVIRRQPQALARLVQVFGLFQSAKIAGNVIWKNFPRYKKYFPLAQRTNWERVWTLQKNLGLI